MSKHFHQVDHSLDQGDHTKPHKFNYKDEKIGTPRLEQGSTQFRLNTEDYKSLGDSQVLNNTS